MFLTLRIYLVIILTVLQLFIPLVHAHTGDQSLKPGLHIPGLEHYEAKQNKLTVQIKALQHNDYTDGMIVAIDMGVKQHQINPLDINDSHYFIHQTSMILNIYFLSVDANYFPQHKHLLYPLLIQENSPRAPPSQDV